MADRNPEHGLGAENAPGHTQGSAPGEKPVASDSGTSTVGVDKGTNQPGEKGLKDPKMPGEGEKVGQGNMT